MRVFLRQFVANLKSSFPLAKISIVFQLSEKKLFKKLHGIKKKVTFYYIRMKLTSMEIKIQDLITEKYILLLEKAKGTLIPSGKNHLSLRNNALFV